MEKEKLHLGDAVVCQVKEDMEAPFTGKIEKVYENSSYLEPAVIIISSLGFTMVSMIYALAMNFWLGWIFICFYSIPALCSSIGSKQLDRISDEKTLSNEDYLSQTTNIIGGVRVIQNYGAGDFFFHRFKKVLGKRVEQDILRAHHPPVA